MAFTISRAAHDAILAHAASEPDFEVCGLLFGTANRIDHAQPCANVSDQPWRRFEIDPAALIAAHKIARAGGPKMIGSYHSHPNGNASPSSEDRTAAPPDDLWAIAADGRVTLWRMGPFDPQREPLTICD